MYKLVKANTNFHQIRKRKEESDETILYLELQHCILAYKYLCRLRCSIDNTSHRKLHDSQLDGSTQQIINFTDKKIGI